MLGILLRPVLFLLKLPFLLGRASKPALDRVVSKEGFTYGDTRKEGDKTILPLGYHPPDGEFELIADLELTSEYICLRPVNGWTQSALSILGALVPEAVRFLPGREREVKPVLQDADEPSEPVLQDADEPSEPALQDADEPPESGNEADLHGMGDQSAR